MVHTQIKGHLIALLTLLIWGTTFVSTKVLLRDFAPIEILFFRFVLGLVALSLMMPRRLKGTTLRQEATFAAAGLTGICLYYLLENIALTFTLASNVALILSVAPCFTALLSRLFLRGEEALGANFFFGFVVAIFGIALISFNGSALSLNPLGDVLAFVAAFVWACYSILTRKMAGFGYAPVMVTRRTFFYGLLWMLPTLGFFDFQWDMTRFAEPVNLANLLFLGLGASALGFVSWNVAVKILGAVKTSLYIYLSPVITVVTSVIVLHEPLTPLMAVGIVLTLAGLFVSEGKLRWLLRPRLGKK